MKNGIEIGCPLCGGVVLTITRRHTTDELASAMASYMAHWVLEHEEEMSAKRTEVLT